VSERLGYVVLTYGLKTQRPFAGFLIATRAEAARLAESAKTGPGERHIVAEVFEDDGEDEPA
jgi:hypothetical protein